MLQVRRLFQVLVNRFIASSPQCFVSDVLSELVDGDLTCEICPVFSRK